MDIYSSISSLKGVGPKSVERYNKLSIFNILDLLLYFPRDYEYVTGNTAFEKIDSDTKQILACTAVAVKKDIRTRTGKNMSIIEFEYDGHKVEAKWFNQPYIKNVYKIGNTYNLIGKFKRIGNNIEIVNPTIAGDIALKNEIIPKYPLMSGVSNKQITTLVSRVLDSLIITENLPKELIDKYKLLSLDESIREIHFPKDKSKLEAAIRRLKFQELFTYSLKLLLLKNRVTTEKNGISFPWNDNLTKLKAALPFQLTNAQTKAIREILIDQKSCYPMNRLVQGDVGSGKTIVALIAIYNVYTNGYKAALMVPTEILANQHFDEAKKLLAPFGVDIELLTGSTKQKEKERIKNRIKEEAPLIVIGTHALIQEDVEFNKLGLIVTDEQHRFGVEQRTKLINKGNRADVIVMSATPIPRTLALYIYSDLDVSSIDELPPGRKKIDTKFYFDSKRDEAYKLAINEIQKGRQVYIVCPLIEEDENSELNSVQSLYKSLKEGVFKNTDIAILHGKMKANEKEEIIQDFKENKIKALISTTVIEVGVNVPNASVMIIENAERFGLAQLHQLRGRVGRGEHQAYCILISKAKSNNTKKRMSIMTESTDGFYISEEDLKLRGAGEIFGRRQSGGEGFLLSDLIDDINILKVAMNEAKQIVQTENNINKKLIVETEKSLKKSKGYLCFN